MSFKFPKKCKVASVQRVWLENLVQYSYQQLNGELPRVQIFEIVNSEKQAEDDLISLHGRHPLKL
jgi:hypothetical protein